MPGAKSGVRKWLPLVEYIGLCEAVGLAGAYFTAHAIPTWYASLTKPPFNPPNWLFGPVWTLLYICIGIAGWRIWREPSSPHRNRAFKLWWIQLALNAIWTPIFFGAHATFAALIVIVLLDITVLALLKPAFKTCTVAGALLLPYLAWILFATLLNEELWRLNR